MKKVGSDYRAFEINQWIPTIPDTVMEVTSMTAQDDRVVIEGIVRMTHTGDLTIWVKDPVPATNKKVEFGLCGIATWKNGKITEYRTYMSPMAILGQLGITDNIAWPASS
jgi:predicted ester cyclase